MRKQLTCETCKNISIRFRRDKETSLQNLKKKIELGPLLRNGISKSETSAAVYWRVSILTHMNPIHLSDFNSKLTTRIPKMYNCPKSNWNKSTVVMSFILRTCSDFECIPRFFFSIDNCSFSSILSCCWLPMFQIFSLKIDLIIKTLFLPEISIYTSVSW